MLANVKMTTNGSIILHSTLGTLLSPLDCCMEDLLLFVTTPK